VLIADDDAPTRGKVREALQNGGISVCAEADNAAQAVQHALETEPDICLLEVRMPGGGIAAAWEIAARLPTTKVVMLTASDEDADLFSALSAGAVGYLVKDTDLHRLPDALRDVAQGGTAIPRAFVGRIVTQLRSNSPRFRTTAVDADHGRRLTSREWDVLAALADGLSNREIARRLQLTQSGARAHVSHLVHKLGVRNRDEAVAVFRKTTTARVEGDRSGES
jgi:DNA-binding NarL/FixJ family response regulator